MPYQFLSIYGYILRKQTILTLKCGLELSSHHKLSIGYELIAVKDKSLVLLSLNQSFIRSLVYLKSPFWKVKHLPKMYLVTFFIFNNFTNQGVDANKRTRLRKK